MMSIQFKIGDRIRVVSIPQSAHDLSPDMRDGVGGTLTAFRHLLNKNDVHTVIEVDPYSAWPWIKFEILDPDGEVSYHKLMIEPECVELVSSPT